MEILIHVEWITPDDSKCPSINWFGTILTRVYPKRVERFKLIFRRKIESLEHRCLPKREHCGQSSE